MSGDLINAEKSLLSILRSNDTLNNSQIIAVYNNLGSNKFDLR